MCAVPPQYTQMGMKDTEHPLSDVEGSEPMGKEQHS